MAVVAKHETFEKIDSIDVERGGSVHNPGGGSRPRVSVKFEPPSSNDNCQDATRSDLSYQFYCEKSAETKIKDHSEKGGYRSANSRHTASAT